MLDMPRLKKCLYNFISAVAIKLHLFSRALTPAYTITGNKPYRTALPIRSILN